MIPKCRLGWCAFFLASNRAVEVLAVQPGGRVTLQGALRVRVGLDEEHTQQGGMERNREHKRLKMQRKEGYKEKSRKENGRWESSVGRLASFPDCPMARNVSSKSLKSLDQQCEQSFDKC